MSEKDPCHQTLSDQIKNASYSDILEVVVACLDCRRKQREYFKFRSHERLYAAKDAETRLDRALEHIQNIGKPFQLSLI